MTNSSFVEQLLPFHGKIKRLFLDLVGSPHADGIFDIHRELQCRPAHLTQNLARASTPLDWRRFSAGLEVLDDFFIFLTDIPIIFISEDAERALL
jgi:hypothetical protein